MCEKMLGNSKSQRAVKGYYWILKIGNKNWAFFSEFKEIQKIPVRMMWIRNNNHSIKNTSQFIKSAHTRGIFQWPSLLRAVLPERGRISLGDQKNLPTFPELESRDSNWVCNNRPLSNEHCSNVLNTEQRAIQPSPSEIWIAFLYAKTR